MGHGDIDTEIKLIQSRAFEQARLLADATNSTKAVGTYLGIDIETDPAPPTPSSRPRT